VITAVLPARFAPAMSVSTRFDLLHCSTNGARPQTYLR
jgi:hypothetical protein